jgi:hypothetical protein
LPLNPGGRDFSREGRRRVWDPKNTLVSATVSHFDTLDDCLAE